MHPDALTNEKIREGLLDKLEESGKVGEALKNSNPKIRKLILSAYEEKIKGIGSEEFIEKYPSTATYLANTTARGAGAIPDVFPLSEEKINEILIAKKQAREQNSSSG